MPFQRAAAHLSCPNVAAGIVAHRVSSPEHFDGAFLHAGVALLDLGPQAERVALHLGRQDFGVDWQLHLLFVRDFDWVFVDHHSVVSIRP
jgi:hypothetical protein